MSITVFESLDQITHIIRATLVEWCPKRDQDKETSVGRHQILLRDAVVLTVASDDAGSELNVSYGDDVIAHISLKSSSGSGLSNVLLTIHNYIHFLYLKRVSDETKGDIQKIAAYMIPTVSEPMLDLVKHAEDLVRTEMKDNDGSHDYRHVIRVVLNALRIFRGESTSTKVQLSNELCLTLILAALLHDVRDHKYEKKGSSEVKTIDEIIAALIPDDKWRASLVTFVIKNVSFSTRKKRQAAGQVAPTDKDCADALPASADDSVKSKWMSEARLLLDIVQDADTLDAIGAIGVARAFAFGGTRGAILYDADTDIVTTSKHFYEKLVHLYDMMNTRTGSRLALPRHRFLVQFCKKLNREMM